MHTLILRMAYYLPTTEINFTINLIGYLIHKTPTNKFSLDQ